MRVFCISDLHAEMHSSADSLFRQLEPHLPAADVSILAGDIGCPWTIHDSASFDDDDDDEDDKTGRPPSEQAQKYLDLLCLFKAKYAHVIVVAGNHEYYQAECYDRAPVTAAIRRLCTQAGAHFLHRTSVVIDDVEFFGTTLWSLIDEQAVPHLADFRSVFPDQLAYVREFVADLNWLETALRDNKTKAKTVVVTHHLPSKRLIHESHRLSGINSAFATNVVDRVDLRGVGHWFCGHTHEYVSATYGSTLMVANPWGYPNEPRKTRTRFEVFHV